MNLVKDELDSMDMCYTNSFSSLPVISPFFPSFTFYFLTSYSSIHWSGSSSAIGLELWGVEDMGVWAHVLCFAGLLVYIRVSLSILVASTAYYTLTADKCMSKPDLFPELQIPCITLPMWTGISNSPFPILGSFFPSLSKPVPPLVFLTSENGTPIDSVAQASNLHTTLSSYSTTKSFQVYSLNIHHIHILLSIPTATTQIQATTPSHLNYCHSLLIIYVPPLFSTPESFSTLQPENTLKNTALQWLPTPLKKKSKILWGAHKAPFLHHLHLSTHPSSNSVSQSFESLFSVPGECHALFL